MQTHLKPLTKINPKMLTSVNLMVRIPDKEEFIITTMP